MCRESELSGLNNGMPNVLATINVYGISRGFGNSGRSRQKKQKQIVSFLFTSSMLTKVEVNFICHPSQITLISAFCQPIINENIIDSRMRNVSIISPNLSVQKVSGRIDQI